MKNSDLLIHRLCAALDGTYVGRDLGWLCGEAGRHIVALEKEITALEDERDQAEGVAGRALQRQEELEAALVAAREARNDS